MESIESEGDGVIENTCSASGVQFQRMWCMPNSQTFQMLPVAELLKTYISPGMVVVDPFARDATFGTITNDLNPTTKAVYHMEATSFLDMLNSQGQQADVVLLDPPYSPRQISECYQQIGKKATMQDTQNARLYKACKDKLAAMLKPKGIAICFGWNTSGFGKSRGFVLERILLLAHGGAHNDTIITVERKRS
jgi:hypothetical protein